jgi:cell division protein FtsZ
MRFWMLSLNVKRSQKSSSLHLFKTRLKKLEIEQEEEQITLTFDLPISKNEPKQVEEPESQEENMFFSLDEDVKDMDVQEPVEIISVTEVNEAGEKRYALDDFETYESAMNTNSGETEVKEEIVLKRKILPVEKSQGDEDEEIDPMNSPISELIKAPR